MQPPAQELVAKDLHDVSWTFRHIYRGMNLYLPCLFVGSFLQSVLTM